MLCCLMLYFSVCPSFCIAYTGLAYMYLFSLIVQIDIRGFSFPSAEMALTRKQTEHYAFTASLRFLFQKIYDQINFSFGFLFACFNALLQLGDIVRLVSAYIRTENDICIFEILLGHFHSHQL